MVAGDFEKTMHKVSYLLIALIDQISSLSLSEGPVGTYFHR